MAGLGDFMEIMKEAISDMPDKLKVASSGMKDMFTGFNDMVRRT